MKRYTIKIIASLIIIAFSLQEAVWAIPQPSVDNASSTLQPRSECDPLSIETVLKYELATFLAKTTTSIKDCRENVAVPSRLPNCDNVRVRMDFENKKESVEGSSGKVQWSVECVVEYRDRVFKYRAVISEDKSFVLVEYPDNDKKFDRYSNNTIERPFDKIDPANVWNILITADKDDDKLGQNVITLWPLVTGLVKKYPQAKIFISANYSGDMFASKYFCDTIKPVDILPGKQIEFLKQQKIDMIVDVASPSMDFEDLNAKDFPENKLPCVLNIPPTNTALVYASFRDRAGKAFRVIFKEDFFKKIPPVPGEVMQIPGGIPGPETIDKPNMWMVSTEICKTLGLNVEWNDLPIHPVTRQEVSDGMELIRKWYLETYPDQRQEDFDPSRKVIIVNVYAVTLSSLIKENEWADIILELAQNMDDSYLVFTHGGHMDVDYERVNKVVKSIRQKMAASGSIKNNRQIILPRVDSLYPHIHNVLGACSGFVTVDTGLGHLASGAYNIPTLVLTAKRLLHWLPVRKNVVPVIIPELADSYWKYSGMSGLGDKEISLRMGDAKRNRIATGIATFKQYIYTARPFDAPSQMGKRAKGKIRSGNKLSITDSRGKTRTVDLSLKENFDIKSLIRIVKDMRMDKEYKEIVLNMLSLFEGSPPRFYTYDELIEDLFGVAQGAEKPQDMAIALYSELAKEPIAIAHEFCHCLVDSGFVKLKLEKRNMVISMKDREDVVVDVSSAIDGLANDPDYREDWAKMDEVTLNLKENNHYLIRILQRELFSSKDRRLTRIINTIRNRFSEGVSAIISAVPDEAIEYLAKQKENFRQGLIRFVITEIPVIKVDERLFGKSVERWLGEDAKAGDLLYEYMLLASETMKDEAAANKIRDKLTVLKSLLYSYIYIYEHSDKPTQYQKHCHDSARWLLDKIGFVDSYIKKIKSENDVLKREELLEEMLKDGDIISNVRGRQLEKVLWLKMYNAFVVFDLREDVRKQASQMLEYFMTNGSFNLEQMTGIIEGLVVTANSITPVEDASGRLAQANARSAARTLLWEMLKPNFNLKLASFPTSGINALLGRRDEAYVVQGVYSAEKNDNIKRLIYSVVISCLLEYQYRRFYAMAAITKDATTGKKDQAREQVMNQYLLHKNICESAFWLNAQLQSKYGNAVHSYYIVDADKYQPDYVVQLLTSDGKATKRFLIKGSLGPWNYHKERIKHAMDIDTGEEVVLKLQTGAYDPTSGDDADAKAYMGYENEISYLEEALKDVSGIAHGYRLVDFEGIPALVLEYVPGQSFCDYFMMRKRESKHISEFYPELLDMVVEIGYTLKAINDKNVCHHDNNPHNFIITPKDSNHKGKPIVIDFNLSVNTVGESQVDIYGMKRLLFDPFLEQKSNGDAKAQSKSNGETSGDNDVAGSMKKILSEMSFGATEEDSAYFRKLLADIVANETTFTGLIDALKGFKEEYLEYIANNDGYRAGKINIKKPSEAEGVVEREFVRDLTKPEELARNLKESLVSASVTRKVVLAFDKRIGGLNSRTILDVFKCIEELKKDEEYRKHLNNLVVTEFDPENPSDDGLEKYINDNGNEIFIFRRLAEKEEVFEPGKDNVHISFINETQMGLDPNVYYPLPEIVAITLAQYLTEHAIEEVKSIQEKINIGSIDPKGRYVLIFTLLPKITCHDSQDFIKRYANLKELLRAA